MEWLTRAGFGTIAAILLLLSLVMTFYAIAQTVEALVSAGLDFGQIVLRSVGYVIVSVAVFEVAKYLVEEEVLRGREMRSPTEARRSLTKFVSTISIAIFLEGLVTVFRVSHSEVADLIYPILLLLTGVVMMLGLGAYQRMSVAVEARVDTKKEERAS